MFVAEGKDAEIVSAGTEPVTPLILNVDPFPPEPDSTDPMVPTNATGEDPLATIPGSTPPLETESTVSTFETIEPRKEAHSNVDTAFLESVMELGEKPALANKVFPLI